jgi:hypothetical protein
MHDLPCKDWTENKFAYIVKEKVFNIKLNIRYAHLRKAKPIHKRHTHHSVHMEYDRRGSVDKKNSGHEP